MHLVDASYANGVITHCGCGMSRWSMVFLDEAQAAPLLSIICRNCKGIRIPREESGE
jgi:hypothetical protein